VIQIEKFAHAPVASSGEFLDHHTLREAPCGTGKESRAT
jgi:hypothetical protein